jgi:hypothetical protein
MPITSRILSEKIRVVQKIGQTSGLASVELVLDYNTKSLNIKPSGQDNFVFQMKHSHTNKASIQAKLDMWIAVADAIKDACELAKSKLEEYDKSSDPNSAAG